MDELYKKYRPKDFDEVEGQEKAVQQLQNLINKNKVPHCILLSGPSGCGKTTIARIMRKKLNCMHEMNYVYKNSAEFRGIDTVRGIAQAINLGAVGEGDTNRLYLFDEVHKLTNDAQNAFLNMLEDTPSHVYFIFCTTDPGKLIDAVKTRFTHLLLVPLNSKQMRSVIDRVLRQEKKSVDDEVIDRIVDVSDGSVRRALVLLHQVIDIDSSEEQLDCILKSDHQVFGFDLAKALLDHRSKWPDIARILKASPEEPETIRHIVLGYCNKVLLGGGKMAPRAFRIITIFSDNWYDSKKAGLTASCYEAICIKD